MSEFKSTTQRRLSIVKALDESGSVDVNELSEYFGVSEVTIRKDLRYLESKNLLLRSRGGALKPVRVGIDIAIDERKKIHLEQKFDIGLAAAQLIRDGDAIILDSGTTMMELAKNLGNFQNLTVITNAIDIASKLVEYEHMNVIIPGGILRKKSLSLVGVMAAESFKNLRCDIFFFSADGIHIEEGLTTPNIEEANLSRLVMKNAKKVVALVDSSKFQRSGLIKIAGLDEINILITDAGIPEGELKKLKKTGIGLIVTKGKQSL